MAGDAPRGEDRTVEAVSGRLRDLLEPVIGQVYFSPECHAAYERLGFSPSRARAGDVHLPDGPAYFTSRGSCLGQVPGEVVAATFAVFNAEAVVPAVALGWSLTDAPTIAAARFDGAVAQLRRVLGPQPEGVTRVVALLRRTVAPMSPACRPLFAGCLSLGVPGDDGLGDLFRYGDQLRELRGDAHNAAWAAAGLDAIEIGLLTELWWRLPPRTYIRTRAWSTEQVDAAVERLRARGLVEADGFTPAGRALRADIEAATGRQLAPAIAALGDGADELFGHLEPWGRALRAAGAYLTGPDDLT